MTESYHYTDLEEKIKELENSKTYIYKCNKCNKISHFTKLSTYYCSTCGAEMEVQNATT